LSAQDLERLAAIKRLVGSPVALVADATGVVIEPVPPNLALQVKAGVLPKDMRNKLLTARPSSSVALDSTRASVNSPQHLRDQQQSNITVQRDADGALNVTLSPTTSAQASQTVGASVSSVWLLLRTVPSPCADQSGIRRRSRKRMS
jgi:hypothetical protein